MLLNWIKKKFKEVERNTSKNPSFALPIEPIAQVKTEPMICYDCCCELEGAWDSKKLSIVQMGICSICFKVSHLTKISHWKWQKNGIMDAVISNKLLKNTELKYKEENHDSD